MEEENLIIHSKWNMASYSIGDFIMQTFAFTFTAYVFFFYEVEVGLDSWLVGLGFIIYTIWNAINDPLVGYICDKTYRFTRRWGRRFPWIVSSMFPSILIYVLLYTPPEGNQMEIFIWLIFATCLFDTTLSFWGVNSSALFPDKFRDLNERRTASGIKNAIGYLGIAFGALVPPIIVGEGGRQGFIDQAWALVIVTLIAGIFAIPGFREDKEYVERYIKKSESLRETQTPPHFFKSFISAFKQKNFVAFVFLFLSYSVLRACLLSSLQYGLMYILELPLSYSTILMGAYLVASLITIPLWVMWIKRKNDNRKIMIISSLMSALFTIPMLFFSDLLSWIIILILWGIGIAGMFVAQSPVFGDIIDENVVLTKTRKEGLFNGFYVFILRFSTGIQAIIFASIHELTGFVEGAETQTEFAIFGLQIAMALIPSILMVIGALVFWKYYDLTPEKSVTIRQQLNEIQI